MVHCGVRIMAACLDCGCQHQAKQPRELVSCTPLSNGWISPSLKYLADDTLHGLQ